MNQADNNQGGINQGWALTDAALAPLPRAENFRLVERPMVRPAANQMLSRTIYISLDPYQWFYKLRGAEKPGNICHARTISQVIESRLEGFSAGDYVFNTNGWARYGLTGEGVPRPGYMIPRKLDPAHGPISYGVGVLGMLGLTAYAGMILEAQPRAGETAVISAASGGVGQIAGQLAKIRGCRVVGIAGAAEKCRYVVEELGFDACVSHQSATFGADLAGACPNGVDVYFENVGGAVFDAVAALFNMGARMAFCGVIASLTDGSHTDPKQALLRRAREVLQARRVSVHDFSVGDYVAQHQSAFLADMGPWVREGKVKYREDIRQGLEETPRLFIELLRGGNFGKMLVQVSEDPTRA
ncbi:MAG: NADP-dependent oxidoreductase [Hyphomonadaceae bacterium]